MFTLIFILFFLVVCVKILAFGFNVMSWFLEIAFGLCIMLAGLLILGALFL